MKKIIALIILFAGVTTIRAQETAESFHTHETAFGLKAGLNVTDLMSNHWDYDPSVSFNAGGIAHLHISDHFAIQPELMYSGQGAVYEFMGQDYRINLHYLNVPVLFQYMFGHGWRAYTGPQVGFMMKARVARSTDDSFVVDDSFKTTDVAWSLGLSKLFHSGFGLDARYNYGLTDISNSAANVKNGAFQLGAFYMFMH